MSIVKLKSNTVHLWLISSTDLAIFDHFVEACLTGKEHAHAVRYADPRKATWYRQKQAALRFLLGQYVQRSPEKLVFDYHENGKPTLRNAQGLEYNVSHARGHIAVAITQRISVGVDIECVVKHARDDLAQRILGPYAIAQYYCLGKFLQRVAFAVAWSEREAFVKMHGWGIADGWKNILAYFKNQPLCIKSHFGASNIIAGSAIYHLSTSPFYALTLCAAKRVKFIEVNNLYHLACSYLASSLIA